MNSNNLAQYLLNEGEITLSQMGSLLAGIRGREARLPVLALRQGSITSEQLERLDTSTDDSFMRDASEQGMLTCAQADHLRQGKVGETVRFAQCLLDAGLADYARLEAWFRDYDALEETPVHRAVVSLCGDSLSREAGRYSEFMEIFMDSLMDFLHTPSVIATEWEPCEAGSGGGGVYAVSQRLCGGIDMVTGIMAMEQEFLGLARRYSQEEMEEIDELAIDSVEEFVNVVNGIFSVQLAERKIEVDLEPPRWGTQVAPEGEGRLLMRLSTDLGIIHAVVSANEFM